MSDSTPKSLAELHVMSALATPPRLSYGEQAARSIEDAANTRAGSLEDFATRINKLASDYHTRWFDLATNIRNQGRDNADELRKHVSAFNQHVGELYSQFDNDQ